MSIFFFTCNQNTANNYILSELEVVEKQVLKEPNSVQMINACAAKLSDYSYPFTKSSSWTAEIGYPCDRAAYNNAANRCEERITSEHFAIDTILILYSTDQHLKSLKTT